MSSLRYLRITPPKFGASADVGFRAHLVEVRLCEARSWPVDCRHVQEQLASIVPVKLGLRVHGVRDDAPLICRLVSASGCTQPGVRLGFLVAGGTDLCVEDGLPALL